MLKISDRFPLLQRLLGQPTQAERELTLANRDMQRRLKLLNASLSFLTNTLHAAADGVMAPRSKCKKQGHTKLWTIRKPPSTHLI